MTNNPTPADATFDDAFEELWRMQRHLEEAHLDTPETTKAVLSLDKLLRHAQEEYELSHPAPVHKSDKELD